MDDGDAPASMAPRMLRMLATAGRLAWQFIGVAVALWLLGLAYVRLTEVWLAVFVSFIVAAALTPVARRLERVGLHRTAAAALPVVLLVALLVAASGLVVVRVTAELPALARQLDTARGPVLDWLEDSPLQLSREEVAAVLQRSVEDITRDAGRDEAEAEDAGDAAAEAVVGEDVDDDGAGTTADAAGGSDQADEADEELPDDQRGPAPTVAVRVLRQGLDLARGTGFVLLGFVLAFFLIRDRDRIAAGMVEHLVGGRHDRVASDVLRRAWTTLRGYVRASLLVGAVDATLIGLVLVVVGVPLAGVLTVLTFFAAFVPVVGAVAVGVVSIGVALVGGGVGDALVVAVAVLIVQQLDGNVLQPVLMRIGTGLHPLATILALTVGGVLGGVMGALLAVPVTAVLVAAASALIEAGVGREDTHDVGREDAPGAASLPEGS